jgi:protein TonB
VFAQDDKPIVLDEMPRFPGCEFMAGTDKQKKACADKKLLKFIYGNINYPEEALINEKEGKVIVSFVVTYKGKIEQIKILKDAGYGMGQEAVRVMELMNKKNKRWKPGLYKGQKVNVLYSLPVRFQLSDL